MLPLHHPAINAPRILTQPDRKRQDGAKILQDKDEYSKKNPLDICCRTDDNDDSIWSVLYPLPVGEGEGFRVLQRPPPWQCLISGLRSFSTDPTALGWTCRRWITLKGTAKRDQSDENGRTFQGGLVVNERFRRPPSDSNPIAQASIESSTGKPSTNTSTPTFRTVSPHDGTP